jgi:predicted permease
MSELNFRFADLWLDLRYAARIFTRQPGFAAAAVVTLALGIGATTAIFSVVYGVLLKPLPFEEPERLVSLAHASAGGGRNQGPATYFTYLDNQRVFEAVGGWDRAEAAITGRGDPEQVAVLQVTDAILPLLRVRPLLGRVFRADDDARDAPLRVVLTYGYWQRRFGGTPNVVGQTIVVDGRAGEIIGVLPASFQFPGSNNAVLLLPMQLDRADAQRPSFGFQGLARLKPGVTLSQANADVARMIALLPPGFEVLKLQPNVRPQAEYVIGDIGRMLWILFAAVGVVLLMACGNVANLFLIRVEGRHRDLAVRAALGAGRGRLAQTLLSESVLLAFVGGTLGLLLAEMTIRLLRDLAPPQLPRLDEIAIHPAVLIFAFAVSLLSGVAFGLITVVKFTRPSTIILKEGDRSSSDGPERHRLRNTLVVTQIALALMLMIVSGLLIRTIAAMRAVPAGFTNPATVQTFRVSIPTTVISDPQETERAFETIARRLEQVPGVTSVGLSSSITMDGENNGNSIEAEGFPLPEGELAPLFRFKSVAPRYFETMGIPVIAGRSIEWREIYEGRPVIIVSEGLARRYWREPAAALGKRVRSAPGRPWREIVGVVGDERDDGLDQPPTPIVYWPLLNGYQRRTMAYAVRSDRAGTVALQRELGRAVWSVNPNLPLAAVQTVAEIEEHSMARTAFAMVMLTVAASVALLLAAVGIFGVIAFIVTQRTREIGIRMALGAEIVDVRKMFVRHGLMLTGAGIAIGVAIALVLTRVMSALLFGVGRLDPMTYVAASGVLAAVALLATYLPTHRAARIDPIIAIRADL